MTPNRREEIEARLKEYERTYNQCRSDVITAEEVAFIITAPDDIRTLLAALDDATALLDHMIRDDYAGGFEAGRMAGRAEVIAEYRRWVNSYVGGENFEEAAQRLGPVATLPHDELRRENVRLREYLKRIRDGGLTADQAVDCAHIALEG